MANDGATSDAGVNSLVEAYHILDERRLEIDRQFAGLAPDDQDEAWQALEAVMERLRGVVTGLAQSAAGDLLELRAKAAILAKLLRAEDGGGPLIAAAYVNALALSLTDDIAWLVAE